MKLSRPLPDYLWGIETVLTFLTLDGGTTLPDYLWGIETLIKSVPVFVKRSFQTTYEELKLRPQFLKLGTDERFQTTYEELKPKVSMPEAAPFWPLPDYLWGIETQESRDLPARSSGFQTTYEELKLEPVEPFLCFAMASRLPMRNWNSALATNSGFGSFWLPDYLWGIETRRSRVNHKLELASRLPMRNWNLFTLWILLLVLALPDYLWGIETFKIGKYAIDPHSASRLPMRNWNHFLAITESAQGPLPDYLWGIETWACTVSFLPPRFRLPDYLWGIETIAILFVKFHHVASRLPMRNWNKEKVTQNMNGGSASRLPMRNWNTFHGLTTSISFVLPDYLWGIETWFWARVIANTFLASRLPMRNWNACLQGSGAERSRFQTTYEELKLSSHPSPPLP